MTRIGRRLLPMGCPGLSHKTESHAYLRELKQSRARSWLPDVYGLYDVSHLLVWLILLGRAQEAIDLTLCVFPHVPQHTRQPDQGGEVKAYEIAREEVAAIGALAAQSRNDRQSLELLTTAWGENEFGWRSRTKPEDTAEYYSIVGSNKDPEYIGWNQLRGEEATERLVTVSRCWLWLATDTLIFDHRLPGVQRLEKAGIAKNDALERMAKYEVPIRHLLEVKRLECE